MKQAIKKIIKKFALLIPPIRWRYDNIRNTFAQIEHLQSQIDELNAQNTPPPRLEVFNYHSCSFLKACALNILRVSDPTPLIFCCRPIENRPGIELRADPEENCRAFFELRDSIVTESIEFDILGDTKDKKRKFSEACAKCDYYLPDQWGFPSKRIHSVNLSMIPAPCQAKCIYCSMKANGEKYVESLHSKYYESIFSMLDYALANNLIADDAGWQISSGEIAIHPFKDRILNLVQNRTCGFLTNCFIFDENIAGNLAANPMSSINLSIDCGTKDTWYKIKGLNNFDTVIENLISYSKAAQRPDQITLKYIILPGINDNTEDYSALIEIMKSLQITHIALASDVRETLSTDVEVRGAIITAAGVFTGMLFRNGITMNLNENSFSPSDSDKVLKIANDAPS